MAQRVRPGVLLALLVAAALPAMAAERISVDPAALPPPAPGASATNPPRPVSRPPGVLPTVPPGFEVNLFAEGRSHARWLAVGDDGDVFLAESATGDITLLRDRDGDGRAEVARTYFQSFERPHGLVVRGGFLYVADTRGVWRMPYASKDDRPPRPPELITPKKALGDARGHWTRNLVFSPDGKRMYVAIGSRTNVDEDEAPRATVREFSLEGETGEGRTFASGLRNPVGMAFSPGTDDLYVVVNERDGLGDELAPDFLTRLQDGGFYGWPYSYAGRNPHPGLEGKRPDLVARALPPDLLFRAHSAPLGLAFYDGSQFPPDYKGDAFVALHGSWNAASPRGYMVVRVPFKDGRPVGHYEPFMTGFARLDDGRAEVWGRPVGLAVARDGSLLIADDVGQAVWRVRYTGEPKNP